MIELLTYRNAIPSSGTVRMEFPEENVGHIVYDWQPVDFAGNPTTVRSLTAFALTTAPLWRTL